MENRLVRAIQDDLARVLSDLKDTLSKLDLVPWDLISQKCTEVPPCNDLTILSISVGGKSIDRHKEVPMYEYCSSLLWQKKMPCASCACSQKKKKLKAIVLRTFL